MQEELDSVLRKIKNRKAAGIDEITLETWKTKELDYILLRHCNAVYNQNTIDRWTKGWPRNSQELPRYSLYIHSSQDLQCSTTQLHRTENWENTLEESKWLSEKSIYDISNFDYPSNSRRCTCKKPRGNNIICWLIQGLWLHTQKENGANTSHQRPLKKSSQP